MHEFALAEAVMQTARQTAERESLTRVTKIAVEVGELQQIKKDVFEFALGQTRPDGDARLAETEITVEIVPARFRCRACERVFGVAETELHDDDAAEAIHFVPELAHAFMRCPDCGSPDFEVASGRGVGITSIEGERDDD
jgi:hydrogenase nickel incorporation protein HypA/HybF